MLWTMKITPMALCQRPLVLFSSLKLKDGGDVQIRWESCSLDFIRKRFSLQTEQSLIAHSVALQISHLQENNFHIERRYTFSEPPTIPRILKYTSSTNSGEELDQAQDVKALDATTVALVDSETPSTVIQDLEETLLATQDLESEEFPAVFTSNMDAQATTDTEMQPESEPASFTEFTHPKQTASSGVDESFNTQSSNVPIMKRTIRGMMQFEHMTQGDTQSQGFLHPPHSEGTTSPSTSTRLMPSAPAPKATLSQAMVMNLDESKATLRKKASRLAKSEGSKKQNSNLVLCQCGSAEEEGDMVSQSAAVQSRSSLTYTLRSTACTAIRGNISTATATLAKMTLAYLLMAMSATSVSSVEERKEGSKCLASLLSRDALCILRNSKV
jgi:hypothetical protein